MTNAEAIETLRANYPDTCFEQLRCAVDMAIKALEEPQRKRGKWIYGEDNLGTGRDGWLCSKCGHFEMWDYSADMKSAELNLPNYCPRCGADMRGEQDEAD